MTASYLFIIQTEPVGNRFNNVIFLPKGRKGTSQNLVDNGKNSLSEERRPVADRDSGGETSTDGYGRPDLI